MSKRSQPQGKLSRYSFPLFVPANRPNRYAKAAGSGADTIIIDLEDAVPNAEKDAARDQLVEAGRDLSGAGVWVRINASSSAWHYGDLAVVSQMTAVQGVMVPKAESARQLGDIRSRLPEEMALIALVETAEGIHNAHDIAGTSDRMAFGSIDYALDMNSGSGREAFLMARSTLAIAARIAGQLSPLDGVTLKTDDPELIQDDAAHALELGFGGKMLIHPLQLAPAMKGFAPTSDDIKWAEKITSIVKDGSAVAIDGEMIDAPVLERAKGILERKELLS